MKLGARLDLCGVGGVAVLTVGLAVWSAGQESGIPPVRVIAVGDVHGAYDQFVDILLTVGLIDSKREWTGGSTVLVQTGDVPDRGPATRAALDLLMDLERQAEKQKGRVIPLLGNHEVMNMIGDVGYVSPEDYRTFSNDQSEKVREKAYLDYLKFLKANGLRSRAGDEAARQQWMAEHPLGFFEQRDAFAPKGLYGRWLRQHDAIAQVGDVLFMHGGLNPRLRFRNVQELNKRIRSDLSSFDSLWQMLSEREIIWRYMTREEALRQVQQVRVAMRSGERSDDPETARDVEQLLVLQTGLLVSPDSPFWYRGLALEPEEKLKQDLESMLARLNVRYLVAAHTVNPKYDITTHFDKRVFLIDTGMLKPYFGGRASALEIQGGRFTAYYADGEKQVLLAPGAGTFPAGSHVNSEQRP